MLIEINQPSVTDDVFGTLLVDGSFGRNERGVLGDIISQEESLWVCKQCSIMKPLSR